MNLKLSHNTVSTKAHYDQPITQDLTHGTDQVRLFAVNGFELCAMEKSYAWANHDRSAYLDSMKTDWFESEDHCEGCVLNHSFLLWRCGYSDEAAAQLDCWSQSWPIYHRVRQIRPKWGLDFSMEWVDRSGTVFEILHFEHDFFELSACQDMQQCYQQKFLTADWPDLARRVYANRSQWQDLSFFAQSRWKCEFFGVVPENFGQTVWHLV